MFLPSFFTPFFSLVFLKEIIILQGRKRSPHYPLLCFNLFFLLLLPCWHNSGGYNFLLFIDYMFIDYNPSSQLGIHKKREKASARAVECKRSEAKLIRNSSRENFIHTQIEFDIHATRIYQSGSFLFSRVHFIIFGFYAYLVKKQI